MPVPLTRGKHLYLLLAFALMGVLYPALMAGEPWRLVWQLVFWLVLAVVVHDGCRERRARVVAGVLAGLAIILDGLAWALAESPGVEAAAAVAVTLFFAFASLVVLGDVLRGDRVTVDKLYGAACVYVLIGLTWTFVFRFLHAVAGEDGALHVAAPQHAEPLEGTALMLYHSFVTLSTLGTGDIVPTTAYSRLFTSLEAIVGQLYLIILVARLVGMHIYHTTLADE
jgi:voltage-gated potassium channel